MSALFFGECSPTPVTITFSEVSLSFFERPTKSQLKIQNLINLLLLPVGPADAMDLLRLYHFCQWKNIDNMPSPFSHCM